MDETRNIHELLKLALIELNHTKPEFLWGLCRLFNDMHEQRLINQSEYLKLKYYLGSNKPSKVGKAGIDGFYWEVGEKMPRQEWLKKHITKTK